MQLLSIVKNHKSSLRFVLGLLKYLWPVQQQIPWCLLVTVIGIWANIGIITGMPLLLKTIMAEFEQHKTAWTLYKIVVYGLLWIIGHLKVEQIALVKPLQYGMHAMSADLIMHEYDTDNFMHTKGLFINALKLAQRGFNDFFWDLFLYFFPVFVQTFITIIIFWWQYSLLYAMLLVVGVCGFIVITIKNAQWTIETRKKYNARDTQMIAYLSSHVGQPSFSKSHIFQIVQNRKHAALDKDLRDFCAHSLQWLIAGFGLLVALLVSGYGVITGRLSLADFLVIKSYVLQIVFPLTKLSGLIHSMQKSLTNIEYIFDLLAIKKNTFVAGQKVDGDIVQQQT